MLERKPQRHAHVFIEPAEISITPDGVEEIMRATVYATDEQTGKDALRAAAEMLEATPVPKDDPSRRLFGFSKWNSPWEPTASKSNRPPGSQDPSKN
ncbi:MAG: hypothetical protein HYU49_01915 [Candidatus Levybacteria bacterium]|nr:hypothetical protein [Candidatus Levybacteria bacterium]MBI2622531.1 hypothetical protein [Candidatus Levybacteria bacterium]MBI3092754.1 hypothetical protein [Candidatus Levybacteria bacterium]